MLDTATDLDRWTAYWGGVTAGIVLLVAGAIAFPRTVSEGFLWRYFWGPVVADGHGVRCAVRTDGETVLLDSLGACQSATGIVAEPGYTTVSTVSYGVVLLVAIGGVYLGLERYDIGDRPSFFFGLVPFMFLGGTMRIVEDAIVAQPAATDAIVPSFPATALLISPFIYFVVFGVTIASLFVAYRLAARGVVERYEPTLAGLGAATLLLALGYLAYLAAHIPGASVSVPMLVVTLGGATAVTAVVWGGIERYAPSVNHGTGAMGAVVIWGHTVDGFANVLSLDWADALGIPAGYRPKHVVNRLIIDLADAVQPAEVTAAIGTAWPFLLLKVGVATLVVWLFDEALFEESPRFAVLMLVAILAVGLGPGTRDLLRATIGI